MQLLELDSLTKVVKYEIEHDSCWNVSLFAFLLCFFLLLLMNLMFWSVAK